MGQTNSIGAFEAKNQFSALLERVSHGETVTITKRGKPVAVLAPVPAEESITPREAVANIFKLRKKASLDGLSIRELRDQGKRF
jgi:prevent-host-death family protein